MAKVLPSADIQPSSGEQRVESTSGRPETTPANTIEENRGPVFRFCHASVLIDDEVWMFGGFDGEKRCITMERVLTVDIFALVC